MLRPTYASGNEAESGVSIHDTTSSFTYRSNTATYSGVLISHTTKCVLWDLMASTIDQRFAQIRLDSRSASVRLASFLPTCMYISSVPCLDATRNLPDDDFAYNSCTLGSLPMSYRPTHPVFHSHDELISQLEQSNAGSRVHALLIICAFIHLMDVSILRLRRSRPRRVYR